MVQLPATPEELSPIEARILGVLIEKEKTTPDAYPLTLNSLTLGCNQKTAREPVLALAESEIQTALEELRRRTLVFETYGASGRVLRYAQNFGRVYGLPTANVVLLATLMLRGAQTVSELRANCERLYRFDDASSVQAYLEELAARGSGALVTRLPRQAGTREHRWAHLLCGASHLPCGEDTSTPTPVGNHDELAVRVSRLESEVADLRATIAAMATSRHPE